MEEVEEEMRTRTLVDKDLVNRVKISRWDTDMAVEGEIKAAVGIVDGNFNNTTIQAGDCSSK